MSRPENITLHHYDIIITSLTNLLEPSTTCIFLRGKVRDDVSFLILEWRTPSGSGVNLSNNGAMKSWYTVTNNYNHIYNII